ICRYNGHTSRFYSVAEHSILMARAMAETGAGDFLVLRGLLHDAAEAYICDVVRPLKRSMPDYCDAEKRIESVIWERFGLVGSVVDGDIGRLVKHFDDAILYDEAKALMGVHCIAWHERFAPGLGVEIVGMQPSEAESAFLEMFERHGGNRRISELEQALAAVRAERDQAVREWDEELRARECERFGPVPRKHADHPFIPLSGSQDATGTYTRCGVHGCMLAPEQHA